MNHQASQSYSTLFLKVKNNGGKKTNKPDYTAPLNISVRSQKLKQCGFGLFQSVYAIHKNQNQN